MTPRYLSPTEREAFHIQVWEIVCQIPFGKVATYGQIAHLTPAPPGILSETYRAFGPRWVGGAMAACPDYVPWHRVINAQGKISQRPGADRQRELLEDEGVAFDQKQRIDFSKFGWDRPK